MRTVKQMLQDKSHGLCTTSPDARVFEALKLMVEKNVGALLVIENDKLVGILSERDYVRKTVLHGKSSHDMPVKEIMTERVICVQPNRTTDECMALMTEKRVRHLPV
ncbi:MAG: CBS domain-containing protein, partial [Gallionella sp.]|nr:CBS domain-containing protein [Gallionella sp.]